MQKAISCLLLSLVLSFHCAGWGPTGHRVTGWVAEKYLTKKARTAIAKILRGESLVMASTWMDEIRSDSTYDHMADWHWVTVPEETSYEDAVKNPNGDIIQTLERVMAKLRNKNLSQKQQLEHLRILIHLVGDLHQPLHVGAGDDRGGNNVRVMWFGDQSNLHRIWDSDMIDDTRLSYTELAQSLESPDDDQIRAWQKSSIYDWARESQSYHSSVYNYDSGPLGYRYTYLNYPIVRLRLLQAGVRLAGILNQIYG
jgi:S1/P1 Nuclease.